MKGANTKSSQELDSDDEQSELGSAESSECGQNGSVKGHVKKNHSKIEKRRRDKMNTHINELSTLIPMCSVMSRKLDKLTVLRMAVQHMRALKGDTSPTESNCKPSFLSDEDFKNLILESSEGFLFVVACDRGRILYVSESVNKVVSQSQSDLVGKSFFDLVHPKDVTTVKDQLSCFDTMPRDKTGEKPLPQTKQENKQAIQPVCAGAQRSFHCRMKTGIPSVKRTKGNDGEDNSEFCIMNRKGKNKASNKASNEKKKHVIVHFTGYLKSWPPSGYSFDEDDDEQDYKNMSCLVAVGREVQIDDKNTETTNPEFTKEFESRHSIDGKFTHVDQRITSMCGYLPHELIGKSGYDFFHPEDLDNIAESHKKVLGGTSSNVTYRFLCEAGHYIYLCTKSTAFRNPWTKELEFLICINTRCDHKKKQTTLSSTCSQSHPFPRFILPAPNPQTLAGASGAEATQGRELRIQELMKVIQQQKEQPVSSKEDDPNADPSASKLGALIAESVQSQETTDERQDTSIMSDTDIHDAPVEEQSDSSSRTFDSAGSLVDFNDMATPMDVDNSNSLGGKMPSLFFGASAPELSTPELPEISQPHLLEQLISMQQAIESMESPVRQSENMSVFMNMLEADGGLAVDLDDFLFTDGS